LDTVNDLQMIIPSEIEPQIMDLLKSVAE
jgi:hypothetical protein